MNTVQEFISITPWTMIFSICNLLILCRLLKKFLFKPVMAVLEARQKEIDDLYGDADRNRKDAANLKAQYDRKMSGARAEADGIVRTAMDSARRRSDQIVGEANNQAARMKQKAQSEIEQEKRKAFVELESELSGMAVDIAAQMVSREIDEKDHQALVDEFIRKAGGCKVTELAREYGMGLYELAREENLREEIHSQLQMLVKIFRENPDFVRLLDAHSVSLNERFQVLDDALDGKVHPYILNFIKILCERGSAGAFEACVRVYHLQMNRDYGLAEAYVTTAVPLKRESAQALREKLEAISGKRITLIETVDPSLLGGVRVEMDGHRMDNTIQTRLEALRRSLIGNP